MTGATVPFGAAVAARSRRQAMPAIDQRRQTMPAMPAIDQRVQAMPTMDKRPGRRDKRRAALVRFCDVHDFYYPMNLSTMTIAQMRAFITAAEAIIAAEG